MSLLKFQSTFNYWVIFEVLHIFSGIWKEACFLKCKQSKCWKPAIDWQKPIFHDGVDENQQKLAKKQFFTEANKLWAYNKIPANSLNYPIPILNSRFLRFRLFPHLRQNANPNQSRWSEKIPHQTNVLEVNYLIWNTQTQINELHILILTHTYNLIKHFYYSWN